MQDDQITTTDAEIGLDDVLIAQAVGKPYVLVAVGRYPDGATRLELSMKDVDEPLALSLLDVAAEALRMRGA